MGRKRQPPNRPPFPRAVTVNDGRHGTPTLFTRASRVMPFCAKVNAPSTDDALDAEGHSALERIGRLDRAKDQLWLASRLRAEVISRLDECFDRQSRFGTAEQIAAIADTGACPLARHYWLKSWLFVALDTACWAIAAAQLFRA